MNELLTDEPVNYIVKDSLMNFEIGCTVINNDTPCEVIRISGAMLRLAEQGKMLFKNVPYSECKIIKYPEKPLLPNECKAWTMSEVTFLREHQGLTNSKLSRHLGRTPDAISAARIRYKIHK